MAIHKRKRVKADSSSNDKSSLPSSMSLSQNFVSPDNEDRRVNNENELKEGKTEDNNRGIMTVILLLILVGLFVKFFVLKGRRGK